MPGGPPLPRLGFVRVETEAGKMEEEHFAGAHVAFSDARLAPRTARCWKATQTLLLAPAEEHLELREGNVVTLAVPYCHLVAVHRQDSCLLVAALLPDGSAGAAVNVHRFLFNQLPLATFAHEQLRPLCAGSHVPRASPPLHRARTWSGQILRRIRSTLTAPFNHVPLPTFPASARSCSETDEAAYDVLTLAGLLDRGVDISGSRMSVDSGVGDMTLGERDASAAAEATVPRRHMAAHRRRNSVPRPASGDDSYFGFESRRESQCLEQDACHRHSGLIEALDVGIHPSSCSAVCNPNATSAFFAAIPSPGEQGGDQGALAVLQALPSSRLWHHERMTWQTADALLSMSRDGTFLVRGSAAKDSTGLVIAVKRSGSDVVASLPVLVNAQGLFHVAGNSIAAPSMRQLVARLVSQKTRLHGCVLQAPLSTIFL